MAASGPEVDVKRWVPVLVSVAVLLSACGSPGEATSPGDDTGSVKDEQPSGGKGDPPSTTVGDDETLTTVDQVTAALAADHASTDWYPFLAEVTLETFLGAPVLLLHVTWDETDTDFQAMSDRTQAMLTALQDYGTPLQTNVATLDGSGHLFGAGSTSEFGAMPMADRFDLPPVPTTAEETTVWLATVYGPGGLVTLGPGETWYSAIQSIGPGADSPLTVTTTLAADDSVGMMLVQLALQTTGSALLENFAIVHSGGFGSAGYAPPGEPGAWGYYYFP